MPKEPRWQGQVPILYFDLAQVTAIASATRSEVFWAFNAVDPLSVKQVGESLKKSPATVRFHVNELLNVGLLMAVEYRKQRSRTEEAYVHSGMEFRTQLPPITPEYRELINKGFDSILRQMSRERSALIRLEGLDSDLNRYLAYRRHTIRVSPETAALVKRKLIELSEEIRNYEDREGVQVHVAVYMSAILGETKELAAQMGALEIIEKPLANIKDE